MNQAKHHQASIIELYDGTFLHKQLTPKSQCPIYASELWQFELTSHTNLQCFQL